MSSYHDLSYFQRGFIVGAREMGHILSHTTILRVYLEYKNSGKTSNLRQQCVRKKTVGERDQCQLARIVSRDRPATLPQITSAFNVGPSANISETP
uniref:Transposase Tc1-like domain-containing protein n=1 Tax=Esox lucius TaxID=8010 RepID=A0A3P8ZV49_ESOLU